MAKQHCLDYYGFTYQEGLSVIPASQLPWEGADNFHSFPGHLWIQGSHSYC